MRKRIHTPDCRIPIPPFKLFSSFLAAKAASSSTTSIPPMPDNSPPLASYPSLDLLRKLALSEINGKPTDFQAAIVAIHSVFLESGFVAYSPSSKIYGIRLPEGWASTRAASTASIMYTLPALLNSERNSAVESVVLDFSGHFDSSELFLTVDGCLSQRRSNLVQLRLRASRFVNSIKALRGNPENERLKAPDELNFFKFRKIVKDELSLPLLISICDAAGLPSPPCFMAIPIDVKLRILEFLPGNDVARTACVYEELRDLASNDDLWKRKCVEEFGELSEEKSLAGQWKQNFAVQWRKPHASRYFPRIRTGPVTFRAPGSSVGPYYLHTPRRS